jgi:PAS domain S-box-containing protein
VRSSDPPKQRRSARQDLLLIALLALAAFYLGRTLGLWDRFEGVAERFAPGAFKDLTGILLTLGAAFAVFGIRRWQQAIREAELREEAERRYRTIVERVPAVAYIWDAVYEPGTAPAMYISPQIEALLGYTAQQWIDDPALWYEAVHPDDRDAALRSWRRALEDGTPFHAVYRVRAADGRTVWIRDEAVPVGGDRRARPIFQGVMFDVTDQQRAEGELRAAEERYRSLVEHLPVTVYTDANDETVTALYLSPQYETLTGYSPEERLADPGLWMRIVHPDDRELVREANERTVKRGGAYDIEHRIRTKDGRTVWVHDHSVPVVGPDGDRVWQGVLTDVTERRLAEEALARQDRILRAASFAAERFLRTGSWADALEDVLAGLGEAGGASRASVYRIEIDETGRPCVALVRGWAAAGVRPISEYMEGRSFPFADAGLERWAEMLSAGELVYGLAGSFPDGERETLAAAGIRSVVAVPVSAGGAWWGYVAFDHVAEDRVWQRGEIDALRVVANTIGAAIERDRAAEELAEAETRYRTLVEQIPAITYTWTWRSNEYIVVYASPQIEGILGYSIAEWKANPTAWYDWIHPDDRDAVIAENKRCEVTGDSYSMQYRMTTKQGRAIWVEDSWVVVGDEDGGHRYFQGVVFDITERKLSEQQLREAEQRHRGLIETIPAATYIDTVDHLSKAVYMSPQIEQIFGYTPEEWLADPELWEQGLHPDDHDEVVARVERLNAEGETYEAEYRFIRRDGRTVWVQDQAVMIHDDEGRPLFVQGVMFDVTARKEAEEQLREAEERFRGIVEHIPAAIYVGRPDESMQTTYVSPQIEDITGIIPDEWVGDPDAWLNALHPEDREEIPRTYLDAIRQERPWSGEYRMIRRDGRMIWVHDETVFLHDDEGRHTVLQGVISDVTDRKLAEQALRDSERREREAAERLRALDEMKNTFLAAVSHELRSPLTTILGIALTLERADMTELDRNDLLERLASNARKLDRLLKDLLDIDRLNRGMVTPQYHLTDVGALARRTVEHLEALSGRSVLVQTVPVTLSVDPAKVERIVENLMMNAARHTTADRTIWLRVEPRDDGVTIAVEDDGPGIPAEISEAIFEPFRQGPNVSSHAPGTGIGLSLVARFAELHGGRAWVEERKGGGASFRVFLPSGSADETEGLRGDGVTALDRAEAG